MKTVIIAEPLNGFGLELASELVRCGYFVIGWTHSSADVELVKKTILKRYPMGRIELFKGNLMSTTNVRQTIMNIKLICTQNNITGIHAVICNKHMFNEKYEVQENDMEVQFFENYLVNVLLCIGLKDLLANEKDSRIILPTYDEKFVPKIYEKDLYREKDYKGAEMFAECKYFNRLFAEKWNELYKNIRALVYIDRRVEEGQYLHEEKIKKGLFKFYEKDKIMKGILAMVNLYGINNDFVFKYNKSILMPLNKKEQSMMDKLWEMSISLGNLKYFI